MFKKTFTVGLMAGLAAAALAACGGGSGDDDGNNGNPDASVLLPDAPVATPDAPVGGPDADLSPDAFMPTGTPSCMELTTPATTLSTFPATYSGDIGTKGANLTVPDTVTCTNENAPFGTAQPGADDVIKLTGLTPGSIYYAKITTTEDMGVYVITGCTSGEPGANQCLAFSDANSTNAAESAKFTAPQDGIAYVVVDFWDDSAAPSPSTYMLSVSTDGCNVDADCTNTAQPVCKPDTLVCGRYDDCVGDDTTAETQSDDAMAGATVLNPAAGATATVNANVCNDKDAANGDATTEFDYYKITTPVGGALTVGLQWADTAADLDVFVIDATGKVMGESFWKNPEQVKVNFLPAGDYYIRVERFTPMSTAVTPYTLSVTRDAVATCAADTDCDNEFKTQLFRGDCNGAGACVPFAGAGAVAFAGFCDSNDDCAQGAAGCTTVLRFQENLSTRGQCTKTCTADTDCAGMTNGVCMTYSAQTKICMPKCATNYDCGAKSLGAAPAVAGDPWKYGTCTVATGQCTW